MLQLSCSKDVVLGSQVLAEEARCKEGLRAVHQPRCSGQIRGRASVSVL